MSGGPELPYGNSAWLPARRSGRLESLPRANEKASRLREAARWLDGVFATLAAKEATIAVVPDEASLQAYCVFPQRCSSRTDAEAISLSV